MYPYFDYELKPSDISFDCALPDKVEPVIDGEARMAYNRKWTLYISRISTGILREPVWAFVGTRDAEEAGW